MQDRIREEEMKLMRGEKELKDAMMSEGVNGFGSASNRPQRPTAAGRSGRSARHVPDSDDSDLGDEIGSGVRNKFNI